MSDLLAVVVIVAVGLALGIIALYRGHVNRKLRRQFWEAEA